MTLNLKLKDWKEGEVSFVIYYEDKNLIIYKGLSIFGQNEELVAAIYLKEFNICIKGGPSLRTSINMCEGDDNKLLDLAYETILVFSIMNKWFARKLFKYVKLSGVKSRSELQRVKVNLS